MQKVILIFTMIMSVSFVAVTAQETDAQRTELSAADLPQQVQTSLTNNYPDWEVLTVYKVEETNSNGGDDYNYNNSQGGSYQNGTYSNNTVSSGNTPPPKETPKKVQTNNRNDNRPDNPSYESQNGTATTPKINNNNNNAGSMTDTNSVDSWSGGTYNQTQTGDNNTQTIGGTSIKEIYYEVNLMSGSEVITVKYDEYGNEM